MMKKTATVVMIIVAVGALAAAYWLGRSHGKAQGMVFARAALLAQETASQDVLAKVLAHESGAILELGKAESLSPALRAALEKWAQGDSKAYGSGAVSARMVLAKHGDEKRFADIKKELLTGGGSAPLDAMEELVYIGNTESVRLIGPFLERDDAPFLGKDVLMRPFSFHAVAALCRLVDHPPSTVSDVTAVKPSDVVLWRQWWWANKSTYGGVDDAPATAPVAQAGVRRTEVKQRGRTEQPARADGTPSAQP